MTIILTDPEIEVPDTEQTKVKWTDETTAELIGRESRVQVIGANPEEEAVMYITWMRGAAEKAHRSGLGYYRLNSYEMATFHRITAAIMPEHAEAKPGSSHAALEQLLGFKILHSKERRTRKCKLDFTTLRFA